VTGCADAHAYTLDPKSALARLFGMSGNEGWDARELGLHVLVGAGVEPAPFRHLGFNPGSRAEFGTIFWSRSRIVAALVRDDGVWGFRFSTDG